MPKTGTLPAAAPDTLSGGDDEVCDREPPPARALEGDHVVFCQREPEESRAVGIREKQAGELSGECRAIWNAQGRSC